VKFIGRNSAAFLLFLLSTWPQSAVALSSQDLFRQAGSYETQGEILKARQTYDQVLKQCQSHPDDPILFRSQVRLARLSVAQSDIKAADSVYRAALKLTPEQIQKDPELMIDMDDLAESYVAQARGNKEGKPLLLCALELRLKINPKHPNVNESYRQLAAHSIRYNEMPKAEHYIKIAIERQKDASTSSALGRLITDRIMLLGIYDNQKRWAESEQLTKEILLQAANYPDLHWCWISMHCALGKCYSRRGQFDLSDSEYRKAIAVAKQFSGASSEFYTACQQAMKMNAEQKRKVKKRG